MGNHPLHFKSSVEENASKTASAKSFKDQNICFCYISNIERNELSKSTYHYFKIIPKIIFELITCYYPDKKWQQLKILDLIDCKSKWNEWYSGRVIKISWNKNATIQFIGFESKFNQTINVQPNWRGVTPLCDCGNVCSNSSHKIAPFQTQSIWNKYARNIRSYDYYNDYYRNTNVYSIDPDSKYVSLLDHISSNIYDKTKIDHNRQLSNVITVIQCIAASLVMCKDMNTLAQYAQPNAVNYELANIIYDIYNNDKYRVISIKSLINVLNYQNIYYWKNKDFLKFIMSNFYRNVTNFNLMRELFEVELKYNVVCNVCSNLKQFKIEKYAGLDLPIKVMQDYRQYNIYNQSKMSSYVIDIHRLNKKPIRHIFKDMSNSNKIKVIAKQIKEIYDTNKHYLLFYEIVNHQILNGFPQKRKLKSLPDTTNNNNVKNIACFVVKNWCNEVTKEDTETYDVESKLLKLTHVDSNGELFGFPGIICYLSTHTQRQINQIIYSKLCVLCESNSQLFPIEKEPKFINSFVAQNKSEFKDNDDIEDNEKLWDDIFKDSRNVPYKLLLLPNKTEIKYDSKIFDKQMYDSTNVNVIIKWKIDRIETVQNIFKNNNNIEFQQEYLAWLQLVEKERKMKNSNANDKTTLYDLVNDFLVEKNSWQNMNYWYCEHCKQNRNIMRSRLDVLISHLPKILIVTLQRFQQIVNYNKINKVIHFDCNGFNLSRFTEGYNNDSEKKYDDLYSDESTMNDNCCYDLYAVICHENNGEYFYNYILDKNKNQWYLFNYHGDIIKTNELQFHSSNSVYILFYKKRETENNLFEL